MKKYEQFGIFDFSEYADELSIGDLIQVNGGSCGSGCGGGGGGGPSGGPSYTPPSTSTTTTSTTSTCNTSNPPSVPGNEESNNQYKNSNENGKSVLERIIASIKDNLCKAYNYVTGYRCDNWVEEVLNDAGIDTEDYLKAGKADEKTVQEHIDELKKGKEGEDYTTVLPTKDGAYVVFMDDGNQITQFTPYNTLYYQEIK